ncbi:hypothetical protein Tco_0684188 [Tanacetum coccineum]
MGSSEETRTTKIRMKSLVCLDFSVNLEPSSSLRPPIESAKRIFLLCKNCSLPQPIVFESSGVRYVTSKILGSSGNGSRMLGFVGGNGNGHKANDGSIHNAVRMVQDMNEEADDEEFTYALHLYNSGLKSTALNLDVYGTELTMDMFRETVNQNQQTKNANTITLKKAITMEQNFSLDYKITAEVGVVTEGEGSDPCLDGRDAHRLLYIENSFPTDIFCILEDFVSETTFVPIVNHNNGRGDGVTDGACMMVAGIEAKGPLPTPLLKIEAVNKSCRHRKCSRKKDMCSFSTQTSQLSPKGIRTWCRGGRKMVMANVGTWLQKKVELHDVFLQRKQMKEMKIEGEGEGLMDEVVDGGSLLDGAVEGAVHQIGLPFPYKAEVYSEIVAEVWDELQETYDKIDGYVIHKIHGLKQGVICLLESPLPDVKEAFNIVSREESHRGLHPSSGSSSEAHPVAFVAKSNNLRNNDVIRGNTGTNKGPNSNLLCKNYGLIDHTIERCYEIIGYPTGFKRNPKLVKQADNFNSRSFNGNVEAQRGASTSTRSTTFENAFTKEQMMKILSLINEKPIGNANANMAGRYGVSAPELHKEPQRFKDLYAVSRRHHTSYSRIKTKNILEDIKRGLHSKKTLIRPLTTKDDFQRSRRAAKDLGRSPA